MAPVIALWLALLASQPTTPPPAVDSPATQPAPSNSAAHHLYKIGDGGVTAPKILYQVEPQFTKEARKIKLTGIATVALIADTDGNPTNVHIIHSVVDSLDQKHHDKKHIAAALTLDQAAVDTVKKYKFSPATQAGKPIPVELNVQVNFQIF